MKFLRFGGLSSVTQTHYEANSDGYHNPPVKRGIYAMPYPMADKFMLGATCNPRLGKTHYVKDNAGNKMKWDDHISYDKNYKWTPRTKWTDEYILTKELKIALHKNNIKLGNITSYGEYITYYTKPRIFDYNGLIWHHLGNLGIPILDYITTSKAWYLSDIRQYEKLLNILYHDHMKTYHREGFSIKEWRRSKMNTINSIDAEVFIEKV